MDDKQFQELKETLVVIAKLLAANFVRDKASQKDQILALSSLRFTNSQVAEFLGTTSDIVRATVNREKGRRKGKQKDRRSANSRTNFL